MREWVNQSMHSMKSAGDCRAQKVAERPSGRVLRTQARKGEGHQRSHRRVPEWLIGAPSLTPTCNKQHIVRYNISTQEK